jgi:uncharacterized protein (TIGR02996 family)
VSRDYRDDPEYQALYAAIIASPFDHNPRLVLADWLEEQIRYEQDAGVRHLFEKSQMLRCDPDAMSKLVVGSVYMPYLTSGHQVYRIFNDPNSSDLDEPDSAHFRRLDEFLFHAARCRAGLPWVEYQHAEQEVAA